MLFAPLAVSSPPQEKYASPSPGPKRFDVASFKRLEGTPLRKLNTTSTSLTMDGIYGIRIMMWAYGLEDFQIIGPSWLSDIFYRIDARTESPATEEQLRVMLQSLLADRLGLLAHWETRQMTLDVIRISAAGLHDIAPSSETAEHIKIQGGLRIYTGFRFEDMAELLSSVALPTIDLTGVPDRFDFSLDLDKYLVAAPGTPRTQAYALALRSAAEHEIGLTFQHERTPVKVLVIDHLDKTPTAD